MHHDVNAYAFPLQYPSIVGNLKLIGEPPRSIHLDQMLAHCIVQSIEISQPPVVQLIIRGINRVLPSSSHHMMLQICPNPRTY